MEADDHSKRSAVFKVLRKIMSAKELRHSWSRENNFAYTDLEDLKLGEDGRELLRALHREGFLIESGVTTILSCPSCGKSDYIAILRCVKCNQSALRKELLLEHKAGGHVHPESAFKVGGSYVCPTCGRTLAPQDYRVVGSWFVCEKCGEKQPLPKVEFRCLVDATIFTEATSGLHRLSDYRISEKGMAQLEYDKYKLVEDVASIAERSGVRVIKRPSQVGASGITHVFDLSLDYDHEDVKVDVVYSKDVVEEKDVLASYAKLIDTGVQRYVLIAWPKLSSEAKALITFYKMNVVEASTLEELERIFVSLLDGFKGGGSSPSSGSKYKAVSAVKE